MDSKVHLIKNIFRELYSFNIPNYQRPYAWTEKETERLLDDLIYSMGDEGTDASDVDYYFLGIIVLVKNKNSEYDILDGQQRLATLTILFVVLRELLPEKKALFDQLIYRENSSDNGKCRFPRLSFRENDQKIFEKYLENHQDICHSNRNNQHLSNQEKKIIENGEILRSRIEETLDTHAKKQQLVDFLLDKCYVLVASTSDLNSAYRIFSCLNDRGLNLSATDILKADVMGNISQKKYTDPQAKQDQENHYSKLWEKFEEKLGREEFENLFCEILIITKGKPLRELKPNLLDEFRQYAKKRDEVFIDRILAPFVDAFDQIKSCDFNGIQHSLAINELFNWLNHIEHNEWRTPAIFYLKRYHNYPDKVLKFFKDLECLAAGLMIKGEAENKRINRYLNIVQMIRKADKYGNFSDKDYSTSPLKLKRVERQKISNLLNGDLHKISRSRKYILLRLNSLISEENRIEDRWNTTIEHVLPKKPTQGSKWNESFSSEEERKQYVERLGNLILLPKSTNYDAGNLDFEQKKRRYGREPIVPFSLTINAMAEEKWTPEIIDKRQKYLLGKLQNEWYLPAPQEESTQHNEKKPKPIPRNPNRNKTPRPIPRNQIKDEK